MYKGTKDNVQRDDGMDRPTRNEPVGCSKIEYYGGYFLKSLDIYTSYIYKGGWDT